MARIVVWEVLGINCCVDYRKLLNGVVVRLGAFCCFYVFFYHLENLSEIQLDFLIVFQEASWYNEVNKKAHDEGCGIDV